jgi:hypothetical protein
MSWDLLVLAIPREIDSLDELADLAAFQGMAPREMSNFGPRDRLVEILERAFTQMEGEDKELNKIHTESSVLQVSIATEDPVREINLGIHCGDDDVLDLIKTLCEHTGGRSYDPESDAFLDDIDYSTSGLERWPKYRDHVLGSAELDRPMNH